MMPHYCKISSLQNALLAVVIVAILFQIFYYFTLFKAQYWDTENTTEFNGTTTESLLDSWKSPYGNKRIYLTSEETFKLRENSCKIPVLNPFTPSMTSFFQAKTLNCSTGKQFYFRSNVEHQNSDNPKSIITMYKKLPIHWKCCHEPLRFTKQYKYKPVTLPTDGCKFFSGNNTVVPSNSEYIIIKCWDTSKKNMNISNKILRKRYAHHYELLFYIPKPSPELLLQKDALQKEQTRHEDQLNVIIIGYDQVSRANFIRLLKETFRHLHTKMDAIDLQGFNKVGDATLNNTLALLTGHDFGEITNNTDWWDWKNPFFDSCPWIWKNFSAKGYITGYADDYVSVFNYRFQGFEYKPTDYYLEPFMGWYMNWTMMRWNKFGRSYNCIGNEMAVDLLQDHARKFSSTMNNHPYFHFAWISRIHELPGYASLADKSTLKTLEHFQNNGILNKSLVIMLSDHGWRADPIMLNPQARLENRLSFAFILLPQWFRDKYPMAYGNMKENQYRLTTPYDIHSTLEDLLNPTDLLADDAIDKRSVPTYKGISLFLPVPKERTCASAGIDEEWCACTSYKRFAVNNTVAIQLGKFAIKTLNSWLQPFPSCEHFNLGKIISAEVKSSENVSKSISMKESQQFRIAFGTRPMSAYFEVTIFTDAGYWQDKITDKISMSTEVFRLDRYNSTDCINIYQLKKICSCKNVTVS